MERYKDVSRRLRVRTNTLDYSKNLSSLFIIRSIIRREFVIVFNFPNMF